MAQINPNQCANLGAGGSLSATTNFIYNAILDGTGDLIAAPGSGNLFYDPDGTGALTPLFVAQLQGAPTLVSTDIYV